MSERNVVRVREVMSTRFDTVDGMVTVSEALALMCKIEAECLIVDKRHDDDEYGMLLVSDIARHVLGKDRAPERVNVYEVTAKPVIENGKVVGIVSFSNLVFGGLCRF